MYKSHRIIDGKPRLVIVDEDGKIVNGEPSKEDIKDLQEEPAKGRGKTYSDEDLLKLLNMFYQENGRTPIWRDFVNNHEYPCWSTYKKRFGSWNNALKLVV